MNDFIGVGRNLMIVVIRGISRLMMAVKNTLIFTSVLTLLLHLAYGTILALLWLLVLLPNMIITLLSIGEKKFSQWIAQIKSSTLWKSIDPYEE